MRYQLTDGVNLEVIPTNKFNMNQILINFATPQTADNATARNLLANLLETSTNKYPTQTELADQLAKMYGAYVNMGVSRVGRLHCVRLKASFVNNELANEDLFQQLLALIQEMLFNPLVSDNQFDAATFARQAVNLQSTIKGYYDDKQFWAARRLLDLYYRDDSVMKIPSFGRAQAVSQLTPASVYQTYQRMLANDRVDIFFLGNIDEEQAKQAFAQLPFTPRPNANAQPEILYHQPLYRQVQRQVEYQPVSQAKLNIGYQLPLYSGTELYYAGIVFNDLFGGSPFSKLYVNIREQAGLAYYAASRLMPFNGLLSVQSGIDSKRAAQVEGLIDSQLADLQAGRFSTERFTEVQNGLANQYLSSNDLAGNILGRRLTNQLLGLPNQDEAAAIHAVTREQVVAVAKMMKKQAVYLLSGEN